MIVKAGGMIKMMALSSSGLMTWSGLKNILPGGKQLPRCLCWRMRTDFWTEVRPLDMLWKSTPLSNRWPGWTGRGYKMNFCSLENSALVPEGTRELLKALKIAEEKFRKCSPKNLTWPGTLRNGGSVVQNYQN